MTMETEEKSAGVDKAATGIRGLDEITRGGLPRGRTVLVSGGPGCGKTLLGLEFLYRGAAEQDEPGVFVCFEETALDLINNTASFGWDLRELIAEKRLFIDHIRVESNEILETGSYDLDALIIRLMSAVQAVGARRIVLDTVESLFASLPNETLLRSELRRLFRWIKDQGLTGIITGESGKESLTRHGLEEYVSDCVLELSRRTEEEVSTRRLQILKYRGSAHETNSYPFLIDNSGFSIVPLTSAGLEHYVSEDRVSTGIPDLDAMFGGKGFYRGSSALISGTAGTGKSSLAVKFAEAACRRGERCIYFSFEEAGRQIIRNMRSIGIDLEPLVQAGSLRLVAERPTKSGLETHLVDLFQHIRDFNPQTVIVDPISSLLKAGTQVEVESILTRYLDFLKQQGVTCLCTNLASGRDSESFEGTEVMISSIMDTWVLLRNFESNGERNRLLFLIKSRGLKHSNQVREFILSDQGIHLADICLGPDGVLFGSARQAREKEDALEDKVRTQEIKSRRGLFEQKRAEIEARIKALEAELARESQELELAEQEFKLGREIGKAAAGESAASRHQTAADRNKGVKR